jgi:hypothetical protein
MQGGCQPLTLYSGAAGLKAGGAAASPVLLLGASASAAALEAQFSDSMACRAPALVSLTT